LSKEKREGREAQAERKKAVFKRVPCLEKSKKKKLKRARWSHLSREKIYFSSSETISSRSGSGGGVSGEKIERTSQLERERKVKGGAFLLLLLSISQKGIPFNRKGAGGKTTNLGIASHYPAPTSA